MREIYSLQKFLPDHLISPLDNTMTTFRYLLHHPAKIRRIKRALQFRCEVCGCEETINSLEIHSILEETEDRYSPSNLERILLVLCPSCHEAIHTFSISNGEQVALVRMRPCLIQEEIQTILAYSSNPYIPPHVDLEEAYREASSPQHFRFAC